PSSQIAWQMVSDNLAGSNSQNMRVLEQSPANTDILFAARYDNKLFRTDDCKAANPEWYDLTGLLPVSGGINDVECHPYNEDIVYLSQNNRIYKSTNRGQSWDDISGTLPNVAYTSIAYYNNSHEGLYVSSDLGVFYRDQFMSDWVMFSNGLPPDASVTEVEIFYDPANPAGDMIRAGTYGRGLWESDMYHYPPTANFTTTETLIPTGCAIDFTDLSSGVPTAWRWEFDGADPAVSYDRTPTGVLYSTPGTFQVKLVVTNEAGADSVIYADYIFVSDTILPMVEFSTDMTNVCTDDIVHFFDNSQHCPDAWTWSFSPGTIAYQQGTNANSQNPVVEFRQSGVYSVTLTVTNQNGQNTLTKTDYIQAGGFYLPFEEDFESGTFAEKSWTVVNPDFGYTWENYFIEETANYAARMKFYGYVKLGERDRLISPYLNFSQFSNVYLTFDHAYSQRFSQKDSLIIYISGGCSEDWIRVWAGGPDGHGGFETAPSTVYEFIPVNNDDWCSLGWGADCFTIDLTDWAGQKNIMIMFEAFNNLGNNLYLDNIIISNITGDRTVKPAIGSFTIYPNPSGGNFSMYASGLTGKIKTEVLNTQGQVVWKEAVVNESDSYYRTINLSDNPRGVYIIRLISNEQVMVRKVIIE
ncbi:MAG: PKD domain-containing protein, partial [Bacteroidales bacterium]|nr:PKD domain-containing protein [Bacteroidales bacterium]